MALTTYKYKVTTTDGETYNHETHGEPFGLRTRSKYITNIELVSINGEKKVSDGKK